MIDFIVEIFYFVKDILLYDIENFMKIDNNEYKRKSIIWYHINNPEIWFGVISAYNHAKYSNTKNKERHDQLIQDVNTIKEMKYLCIEQRITYNQQIENERNSSTKEELSLFIPQISFENCMKLCKKYQLRSYIYKDENGLGLYDGESGSLIEKFKDFEGPQILSQIDIEKAYSQWIRAKFSETIIFIAVHEYYIPSRLAAYRAMKTRILPSTEWIRIEG